MPKFLSPCPACHALNRVDTNRLGDQHAVCQRCQERLRHTGAVSVIGVEALKRLSNSSPVPVVVDFWASWCGPCKMFAPVFEKTADEFSSEFTFAKLDTEFNPDSLPEFQVRSIPTLILFHRGQELARQSGALNQAKLLEWLRAHAPSSSPPSANPGTEST